MLGERFVNDGLPAYKLNVRQEEAKNQLQNKINTKKYLFEKIPCLICGSEDFEQLS